MARPPRSGRATRDSLPGHQDRCAGDGRGHHRGQHRRCARSCGSEGRRRRQARACQSSTMASTALVLYEIDTPLITLIRRIGKEKAVRAWRRSRLAVKTLAGRLRELGVTDAARRDSLYLAGNVLGPKGLPREHAARQASGLPSRFLNSDALHHQFGIARAAALMGFGNLVIDPRKSACAIKCSRRQRRPGFLADGNDERQEQ
jgi:hypothetical protein